MIESVKMSSKGQIVIPQSIRKITHAEEGTMFVVIGSGDTIILKKIQTPSKEEILKKLDTIAKKGKKLLTEKGFTEADLRKVS